MSKRFSINDPYVDFKKDLMKALEDDEQVIHLYYPMNEVKSIFMTHVVGYNKKGKPQIKRYRLRVERIT